MRGVITLAFDDGYEQIFNQVVPILNQYQMRGVFAIPLNPSTILESVRRPIVSWENWLPLKEQGHEIAAHTIHHADITTLTGENLTAELLEPQQKLSATTFVYPGGAYNEETAKEVSRYYQAGRTTKKGFEHLPPRHPLALQTFDYTRQSFSLLKANYRALKAYVTNSWLIETYHLIDDQELDIEHCIPLSLFIRHLQFIHSLPIQVKTIQEVINSTAKK